jgi:integrase
VARKLTRGGKTVYEAVVWARGVDADGKRVVYGRVYGKTNRDAEKAKLDLIAERDGKVRPQSDDITFGELAKLYATRHLNAKRPKTRQMYKTALAKRILPRFGAMPLQSITTEMVETWIADLAAATEQRVVAGRRRQVRLHSDASINVARRCLVSILNRGKKWGYLGERNPAEHADRLRLDPKRANIYQPDDVAAIAAGAIERRLSVIGKRSHEAEDVLRWWAVRDACMTFVLAFAGLRIGELVALRWNDVTDAHIRVQHAQHADTPLGPTKSGKPRDVPLTPEAAAALAWWRAHSEHTRRSDFVFYGHNSVTRNVTPMWASNWRNVFKANAAYAGFPEARPHDMRHTFASMAIMAGVSTLELSYMMGHSDETTTRLYTHLYEHRRKQSAAAWTAGIWDD